MSITGRQCTAARGLLGWKQRDLFEKSRIALSTISAFENDERAISEKNNKNLQLCFTKAGIEFFGTEGLTLKKNNLLTLEGDKVHEQLFQDIFCTLSETGGEVLFNGVDESKSGQPYIDFLKKCSECNIRERNLIKEGAMIFIAPIECYRWLPSDSFVPTLTSIYGTKVAFEVRNGKKIRIILIDDEQFAEQQRTNFESLWRNAQKPKI